jgi:hypothetical protein
MAQSKFSYGDKTENTTKSNMPIGLQSNWMRSKGLDPSKKFMHQLNKIFARETVDLIHVSDRIKLLSITFFKPMDDLVLKLFGKSKR